MQIDVSPLVGTPLLPDRAASALVCGLPNFLDRPRRAAVVLAVLEDLAASSRSSSPWFSLLAASLKDLLPAAPDPASLLALHPHLPDEFSPLERDPLFHDFEILALDRTPFRCSAPLLATRSPPSLPPSSSPSPCPRSGYFANLFRSGMAESRSRSLFLPDVPAPSLAAFLSALHRNLDLAAADPALLLDLLALAHRFLCPALALALSARLAAALAADPASLFDPALALLELLGFPPPSVTLPSGPSGPAGPCPADPLALALLRRALDAALPLPALLRLLPVLRAALKPSK